MQIVRESYRGELNLNPAAPTERRGRRPAAHPLRRLASDFIEQPDVLRRLVELALGDRLQTGRLGDDVHRHVTGLVRYWFAPEMCFSEEARRNACRKAVEAELRRNPAICKAVAEYRAKLQSERFGYALPDRGWQLDAFNRDVERYRQEFIANWDGDPTPQPTAHRLIEADIMGGEEGELDTDHLDSDELDLVLLEGDEGDEDDQPVRDATIASSGLERLVDQRLAAAADWRYQREGIWRDQASGAVVEVPGEFLRTTLCLGGVDPDLVLPAQGMLGVVVADVISDAAVEALRRKGTVPVMLGDDFDRFLEAWEAQQAPQPTATSVPTL